jgi:hypothetical protein
MSEIVDTGLLISVSDEPMIVRNIQYRVQYLIIALNLTPTLLSISSNQKWL